MATKIRTKRQRIISAAQKTLSLAEKDLETALQALEVTERADKKMIGHVLKAAFAKMMVAKRHLASVLKDSDL